MIIYLSCWLTWLLFVASGREHAQCTLRWWGRCRSEANIKIWNIEPINLNLRKYGYRAFTITVGFVRWLRRTLVWVQWRSSKTCPARDNKQGDWAYRELWGPRQPDTLRQVRHGTSKAFTLVLFIQGWRYGSVDAGIHTWWWPLCYKLDEIRWN